MPELNNQRFQFNFFWAQDLSENSPDHSSAAKTFFEGGKFFYFKQATVFSLGHRLSKAQNGKICWNRCSQLFSGHAPLQHCDRWACTPKIFCDNKAEENTENILTYKRTMILKIVFTDMCINISKWKICKHIFPFCSVANLECTPLDSQVYPSLGTPVLKIWGSQGQCTVSDRHAWLHTRRRPMSQILLSKNVFLLTKNFFRQEKRALSNIRYVIIVLN